MRPASSIKPIATVVCNLSPSYVKRFSPHNFNYKLSHLTREWEDPNVPAEELNLGFTQEGGWKKPGKSPSEQTRYRWDIYKDNVALVGIDGQRGEEVEIELTPRARISDYEIRWLHKHRAVVELVAAALAVYKNEEIRTGELIGENAIDFEANLRIMENLLSGGRDNADYLDKNSLAEVRNFLALATCMDTACRTPDKMSKELIYKMQNWYSENRSGGTLWIGCGSENVPIEFRKESALAQGKISEDDYVRYRLEQIKHVLDLGHTPIMFPDQMQHGLGDKKNIELINRILGEHPNKIVLHKLGSPFNAKTDYLNLAVLTATAHLAYGVKTSDPRFPQQMSDYQAIRTASCRAGNPVVMFTGDDRGFPFDFEMGGREQLNEFRAAKLYKRNGYKFLRDKNISALLGYIGLNPHQTIKAIIELSKWFEEKSKKEKCNEVSASRHLENYWKLMAPAMALSTDVFFGENDKTPAYTGRVEVANRFFGVLKPNHGSVLGHRGSSWQGDDLKIMNGRLLVLLVNAGAISVDELCDVIGNNKELLI